MTRNLSAPLSALALVASGLAGAAALSAPAGAASAPPPDTVTLSSGQLAVEVATDFPRVIGYVDRASGATIGGQPDDIDKVVINGKEYAAEADVEIERGTAHYTLTFPALEGVEIEADLKILGRVLTFAMTKIRDTEDHRVGTLEIPGQELLSVSSDQAGAAAATTRIDVDRGRTADDVRAITDATPAGAATGASYAILNTDELAASIESNGSYDQPSDAQKKEAARFWQQVHAGADGAKRLGIRSGQWTYRGQGSTTTSPLPWAKVVVTGDANRDRTVDWQDGAIAFRSIGQVAAGADKTADRVIEHIPFNFASLATHPFLRTLDDVKRLSRATDGLGQLAILKGYGSEGHDSAHPDYGGNYNKRAGGLKDLNTLLNKGEKWGADFGVHVNTTESYAEANAFDETLVDKTKKGWNWLNQAYYIDQRRDLTSGDLIDRFQQLRDETDRNLEFLYIDVYYTYGWIPDEMNRRLRDMGWQVGTEWATHMERNSLWSHWANDENYGGASNKGINSQIIRFIRNGEKDVWNPHPILGTSHIVEAEGWTGQNDWNALKENVWANQLPTKFLQHFDITKWGAHRIDFTDDVHGTDDGGARKLYMDDAQVLDGNAYLLPWGKKGPDHADKLYLYDADGGSRTWQLTDDFRKARELTVYKLSDTGRTQVGTVRPVHGRVTIKTEPGQAYVVYPKKAPRAADPTYGEGTGLKDPGFNAGDLKSWSPRGEVKITTSDTGAREATFGAGAGSLTQRITGLKAGRTYAASAWLEVKPGQSRPATVSVTGKGVDVSRTIERSTLPNVIGSDEKAGTNFQRIRVIFTAPKGDVTLRIAAAAGSAPVRVDDARVVATTEKAPPGATVVDQDFEDVDQGWLPFVSGAVERTDGRTHVTSKHAPYTQAGWNGKLVDNVLDGTWSLKAHEEADGIVYRTHQGTVDFEPSHRYRVQFDFQNAYADSYAWVTGVDQPTAKGSTPVELSSTTLPQQRTTGQFDEEIVTGDCGDTWIGLKGLPAGGAEDDFILDNVRITDLGESDQPGACAREEVSGLSQGIVPGEVNKVTTTFNNFEGSAATDVTQALNLPDGWTATPTSPATAASVEPGASATTEWDVTVPADIEPGAYDVTAGATYTVDGAERAVETTISARTLPAGLIPQSRLSIAGVSDAEPGTGDGSAGAAIDGKAATMWHSAWSEVDPDTPFPHWIALDLGGTYDVKGLDYQVRVGNGSLKSYEVYVSDDGTDWGTPVKTGSFTSTVDVQHLDLPATRGRYVKLVGLSSINGAAFGGANELNLWGERAE